MLIMIVYLKGDATDPQVKGPKLIIHICNTLGGWGRGFVLSISKRWLAPERYYRNWHKNRIHSEAYGEEKSFELGAVQIVQVKHDTWVINMIAQKGIKKGSNKQPIQYKALETCLRKVNLIAMEKQASIHAPRIGTGLSGGRWEVIEPIINDTLKNHVIYIYDFST